MNLATDEFGRSVYDNDIVLAVVSDFAVCVTAATATIDVDSVATGTTDPTVS